MTLKSSLFYIILTAVLSHLNSTPEMQDSVCNKNLENKTKKKKEKEVDVFLDPILSIHVNISLVHDILNTETKVCSLRQLPGC